MSHLIWSDLLLGRVKPHICSCLKARKQRRRQQQQQQKKSQWSTCVEISFRPTKKSAPRFPSLLGSCHHQMQWGRRTALPAVCRLSLTGPKHFSHCWPLATRLSPPEKQTHACAQARGETQTRWNWFTNSSARPGTRSRWPDRSLVRETPLFSVRVQVWAAGCSQALAHTQLHYWGPRGCAVSMRSAAMPTLLGKRPNE